MERPDIWKHSYQGSTYLDVYAKAAFWERFHGAQGPLCVNLADGGVSDNVRVGKLLVGDARRSVNGYIPSFVIEGSDGPAIAIQFVETEEQEWTNNERRERRKWRGICRGLEVTLHCIKVGDVSDLNRMFHSTDMPTVISEGYPVKYGVDWMAYHPIRESGFMPVASNFASQFEKRVDEARLLEAQRTADLTVADLMKALAACSPETRRQFHLLLTMLDGTNSVHPISPANPFRELLQEVESDWGQQSPSQE